MAITPVRDDAIRTGDEFVFPVRFRDLETGDPIDVSAWTWADPEFREYGQADDPVLATGTVDTTDAATGLVIIRLDPAQTAALRTKVRRVGTDLQQTAPAVHTWVEILCDVDPDFTRP